eukprot:991847_1
MITMTYYELRIEWIIQTIFVIISVVYVINTCKRFNRLYKFRDERGPQNETKPSTDNTVDIVVTQILDKIHSHFTHFFHMGSGSCFDYRQHSLPNYRENDTVHNMIWQRSPRYTKLSASFTQLLNPSNEVPDTQLLNPSENIYDFGCDFYYGYKGEQNHERSIAVSPMFASLKDELLNNAVATLNMDQYDNEYHKCRMHFDSPVNKQIQQSNKHTMSYQHLLAIQMYCNFDGLQFKFSKSYRTSSDIRHSYFYYFGNYLKQMVHWFGNNISGMGFLSWYE